MCTRFFYSVEDKEILENLICTFFAMKENALFRYFTIFSYQIYYDLSYFSKFMTLFRNFRMNIKILKKEILVSTFVLYILLWFYILTHT